MRTGDNVQIALAVDSYGWPGMDIRIARISIYKELTCYDAACFAIDCSDVGGVAAIIGILRHFCVNKMSVATGCNRKSRSV